MGEVIQLPAHPAPTRRRSRTSRKSREQARRRPRREAAASPLPLGLAQQLDLLVEAHKRRSDEPVHLAVLFYPPRGGKHLHLLEVVSSFGGGTISRDKNLFQIAFGSTPEFELPPNVELRLTLTSPEELEVAVHENWPSLKGLRTSKSDRSARLLWADTMGKRLWKNL